jgi:hypothetical protein
MKRGYLLGPEALMRYVRGMTNKEPMLKWQQLALEALTNAYNLLSDEHWESNFKRTLSLLNKLAE